MSLIKTWLHKQQSETHPQPIFPITLKDLSHSDWELICTPQLQKKHKELFERLLYTRCLLIEEKNKTQQKNLMKSDAKKKERAEALSI